MTNILSLNNITKKYRVTYDSEQGDVHKENRNMIFLKAKNGLYYFDLNLKN